MHLASTIDYRTIRILWHSFVLAGRGLLLDFRVTIKQKFPTFFRNL